MAIPLKRVLFSMFAVLVLHASPALSVPLSTGMNGQDAAAVSATGSTSPDGEATEARAGIVDNQELALGADASEVSGPHSAEFTTGGRSEMRVGAKSSRSPGWLKPAAAIGAGSSVFAILASSGKGKGNGNQGNGGVTLGGSGNGSGGTTSVGGGKGDDPPSAVPEPGTMLLMGLGVAGYLGRRKLEKK